MTVRARNRTLAGGIIVATIALAATLLPMMASSTADDVREIRVVVRDMSFYVDGGTEPNPAITVRAGERVRIRLRNEDAGMRHDFTIAAWTVATKMLDDRRAEDEVTFRVPSTRGDHAYSCTPHPKIMTGTITVE